MSPCWENRKPPPAASIWRKLLTLWVRHWRRGSAGRSSRRQIKSEPTNFSLHPPSMIPYLELTAILVVLAIVLAMIKLPTLASVEEDTTHPGTLWDALRVPHLALGSLGIFLYVGAEVSIGSYLINFMMDPDVAGYTK